MITNEERRVIANEMRQMTNEDYDFDCLPIADAIAIDYYKYDDIWRFHQDCWERLADLIDLYQERTCHNEASEDTPPLFCCSECGADFFNEPINGTWNYCPNCGARVVSEDE